jgi:hypothetical protein
MNDETQDDQQPAAAALRDLIQSPGWQLLADHVERTWGPTGYGREMQRAIASIPPGPERMYELAQIADRVEATARAIHEMMKWPTEQLHRLAPAKEKSPLSAWRRISR